MDETPQTQATQNEVPTVEPQEIKPQSNAGRPTVMTDETVSKLRQAFLMGANVSMACANAEISRETYYSYLKENPEFSDKVDIWRKNPLLKATHTIYKNLDDPDTAKWYLERRLKEEFSTRQEMTGAEGGPLGFKFEYVTPNPTPVTAETVQDGTPGTDVQTAPSLPSVDGQRNE